MHIVVLNAAKICGHNFTTQTFNPDPANHNRFPAISRSMGSFNQSNEQNIRDMQTDSLRK